MLGTGNDIGTGTGTKNGTGTGTGTGTGIGDQLEDGLYGDVYLPALCW